MTNHSAAPAAEGRRKRALVHRPLSPPRADMDSERVYLEQWVALMGTFDSNLDDDRPMLNRILSIVTSRPTQRMAQVAASFVMWLGTNCGRHFLNRAAQLEGDSGWGCGYLRAWHEENIREPWTGGGFRLIESILATPAHRRNGQLTHAPVLSGDDYEVVEQVARWLSTDDGKNFVARCDKLITKIRVSKNVTTAVERGDFKLAQQFLAEVCK